MGKIIKLTCCECSNKVSYIKKTKQKRKNPVCATCKEIKKAFGIRKWTLGSLDEELARLIGTSPENKMVEIIKILSEEAKEIVIQGIDNWVHGETSSY